VGLKLIEYYPIDLGIKPKMEKAPKNLNEYQKVLTSRGYAIRKDSLTQQEQQQIRSELTVAPKAMTRSGPAGKPFTIYYESPLRFYVPRHWAREKYGVEEYNAMPEGNDLPNHVKFKGKPYDYQEQIIKKFTDADSNGLICVPCGKGKTFMALSIAARLNKRFLVIVDKEFLLNQWKGEMEAFFPGLRIGILQGPRAEVDPEEYDCTLCMIQSLVQKTYPENTFKTYGFTIFDECHHLGASNFSQALLKVQTKWMLGLSATPTRDDGLTKVFEWYLGKPVYWEKRREADPTVIVRCLNFHLDDPKYSEVPVDYKGEPVLARLLTKIVESEERNQWISEKILELIGEETRRILVLGERIKQLERIEEILLANNPLINIGYYIGGMKEEKRETAGREAKVLLASYAMASEAMNIKTLNTVILASPRKKVEQSVGRILRERPQDRKVPPLILDIVDSHGMYQGQWRKRKVFYKACGYKIQIEKYGSDETSEDSSDNEEVSAKNEIKLNGFAFVVESDNED
jgi:superfamily II DNA or RNA helicase